MNIHSVQRNVSTSTSDSTLHLLALTLDFLLHPIQSKRRHGSLGVIFSVVFIVILGIVLVLASIVFFAFGNSLPSGLVSAAQQSTVNSIINVGQSAIALLEILLITPAAATIIAAIFVFMGFGFHR
jgi:hypothetical protein